MFSVLFFNAGYYVMRLADQGLANFLGLRTLRHGMNPLSWMGIHLIGAIPSLGGKGFGTTGSDYLKNGGSKNCFFLSNESVLPDQGKTYQIDATNVFVSAALRTVLPSKVVRIPGFDRAVYWGSCLCGLLFPSIKFRFSDEEIERGDFSENPNIEMSKTVCLVTHSRIYPWKIGLIGTIWAAMSWKTPRNIWNSRFTGEPFISPGPSSSGQAVGYCPYHLHGVRKSALGLVQLALAGGAFLLARRWFAAHQVAALAGAILACV